MDLEKIIQFKKKSENYLSLKLGLISESDCFNAIEMLGTKKFQLKDQINKMLELKMDSNSSQMKSLLAEASQIHYIQSTIVNDVCARFEVIHPEIKESLITEELLSKKRKYWDWYSEQFKNKYGHSPEIKS